jgi:hypothetical protein
VYTDDDDDDDDDDDGGDDFDMNLASDVFTLRQRLKSLY